MSITVTFNGKLRSFETFEALEATVKCRLTGKDRSLIEKHNTKGDALFIAVNPYDAEMATGKPDARIGCILATSQELLDNIFYTLREEI